jgi:Predicted metal-binding integral membrane protein (DUF2182)
METHFQGESEEYRTARPLASDRAWRITRATLLIAVAAVCWAVTARRMAGMDMGPGTDLGGLGWFAAVWATMMAAMMLPSLLPMALTYAGASRDAGASSPTAATYMFACGYLLTWVGAGVLAYGLIEGVGSLEVPWLAWDQGGPYLAGGVILGAALYELTPAKSACRPRPRSGARARPGAGPDDPRLAEQAASADLQEEGD